MNDPEAPEHPIDQYKRALDEVLPDVTLEAVEKAMLGFPLPLADGWDMPRLATVVRRVLASAPRPERLLTGGHRNSPYFIERNSLQTTARKAAGLAQAMRAIQLRTGGRVIARNLLRGAAGSLKPDDAQAMQRYVDIVSELDWLTSFLAEVASDIRKPPPKWETAVERDWRIHVGWGLAAVYEAAFAHPPRAHKAEAGTPFMQFFRRMMAVAFKQGGGGSDFKAVAIEACKRHRDEPAKCGWLFEP